MPLNITRMRGEAGRANLVANAATAGASNRMAQSYSGTGLRNMSSAERVNRVRSGREMTARWQYDLEKGRNDAAAEQQRIQQADEALKTQAAQHQADIDVKVSEGVKNRQTQNDLQLAMQAFQAEQAAIAAKARKDELDAAAKARKDELDTKAAVDKERYDTNQMTLKEKVEYEKGLDNRKQDREDAALGINAILTLDKMAESKDRASALAAEKAAIRAETHADKLKSRADTYRAEALKAKGRGDGTEADFTALAADIEAQIGRIHSGEVQPATGSGQSSSGPRKAPALSLIHI